MRNIPGVVRGDWKAYVLKIRQATGLKTKALADRAGVSRQTWWRWEQGLQKPESAEATGRFAAGFSLDGEEVLWAAGLAIEDPAAAEATGDPRLIGLDPTDKVVRRILAGPWDEGMKDFMLNDLRQVRAAQRELQQQQELAEIERAEEMWRRSQREVQQQQEGTG